MESLMRIINETNSIDFLLALRCTTQAYAKNFVEKGEIKFSTPQSWVAYAKTHGKGRGDVLEGTFACCNQKDFENMRRLSSKYNVPNDSNIEKHLIDGKVLFKHKDVMNLPTFCVYLLKADMFEWPEEEGWHTISTTIPPKFFRDFADQKSPEYINNLPIDKQPSVVFIRDFDALRERLVLSLLSLGINREEILVEPISYYDFNKFGIMGWVDLCQSPPYELTIKDTSFSNQSEARFIINTKNNAAADYLRDNVIHLGPLFDIASIANGYYSEGIEAHFKVELEKYDECD